MLKYMGVVIPRAVHDVKIQRARESIPWFVSTWQKAWASFVFSVSFISQSLGQAGNVQHHDTRGISLKSDIQISPGTSTILDLHLSMIPTRLIALHDINV